MDGMSGMGGMCPMCGPWMMIGGLLLIVALFAFGIWAVRQFTKDRPTKAHETAEQALDRRFASGQITAQEYREIKRDLGGRDSAPPPP